MDVDCTSLTRNYFHKYCLRLVSCFVDLSKLFKLQKTDEIQSDVVTGVNALEVLNEQLIQCWIMGLLLFNKSNSVKPIAYRLDQACGSDLSGLSGYP